MRWMSLALLVVTLCACSAASRHGNEPCHPTGWVDRVEGRWVIVESDDEDAEPLVLPVTCFREPVHGGLRLVEGRVDHEATEELRRRMEEIAERLVKAPGVQ